MAQVSACSSSPKYSLTCRCRAHSPTLTSRILTSLPAADARTRTVSERDHSLGPVRTTILFFRSSGGAALPLLTCRAMSAAVASPSSSLLTQETPGPDPSWGIAISPLGSSSVQKEV